MSGMEWEDPVQRAIPCHAHPNDIFDALLALEENKNPKKKPPLMAHQKKTDLAGALHTSQASFPAQ